LGIGDVVIASVKKGKPDMVKKVVKALIVRQKKEYRRVNGVRIFFEDNAAVLVTDDMLPVGTEIKGVVAREIAERFPKVAAISAGVV
jgi:large subunit ribosomal protein L14